MTPSPDVIEAWKRLDAAQKASEKAAEARAALPAGSTRAKVTTANARWANAAEDRDRKEAAYIAALTAELQRLQPASLREPSTPSNVVPFPPGRADAVAGVASVRQLLHHIVTLDTVQRERLEQQLTQALMLLGGGA